MDDQNQHSHDESQTREGKERFERVMAQLRVVQALKPVTPGLDPEAWKVLDSLLAATRRVEELSENFNQTEPSDK